MYVTLTIVFLILLLLFVFYGWGLIMRRSGQTDDQEGEKCSLCRGQFPKDTLIEREVGDFKLFYFCIECIKGLANDAKQLSDHSHQ